MRNFILIQIYFCSSCWAVRFNLMNTDKKDEAYPVYATSSWTLPREVRTYADVPNYSNQIVGAYTKGKRQSENGLLNNTFEVVVGSKYRVKPDYHSGRHFVDLSGNLLERSYRMDSPIENDTEVSGRLLSNQYDKCVNSSDFMACLKYKTLKFLQDLVIPVQAESLSEVVRSDSFSNQTGPMLVGIPEDTITSESNISEFVARASGSRFGILGEFVLEQLDRFISRHGVIVTVTQLQNGQPIQPDSPWLVNSDSLIRAKRSHSNGKLRRKELAIVFPLLVLFKFFKIKLVLLPILLSVLFIKKMLLIAFTLAPNILGLFRFCRPFPAFPPALPPLGPLTGLQTAGILQEVGDTRGEFSNSYGYASPYREPAGYRQRDKLKPMDGVYPDY